MRFAFGIQFMEKIAPLSEPAEGGGFNPDFFPAPERDRQKPGAVVQDGGFVQGGSVPDAAGSAPDGRVGIGIGADGVPASPAAVVVSETFGEEEEETPVGRCPEVADDRGKMDAAVRITRIENELRFGEGLAVVLASGEQDDRLVVVAACEPPEPDASAGSPRHSHAHGVVIDFRMEAERRIAFDFRGDQCAVNVLHDIPFVEGKVWISLHDCFLFFYNG